LKHKVLILKTDLVTSYLNLNQQTVHQPHEDSSFDESLTLWKGLLSFKLCNHF
jgi:hypothetical protein